MDYKLNEIFNIDDLQGLCDSIFNLNGAPVVILDLAGNLYVSSGFSDICSNYHRVNPESYKLCRYSDTALTIVNNNEKYKIFTCPNGMINVSMPIIIDGEHIGNLLTGQFFLSKPDMEYFKKQAIKFGFDEEEYLLAVKQAPVVEEKELKKWIEFLTGITHIIAGSCYKNLQSRDYALQLKKSKEEAEDIKERFEYATSIGKVGTWDWNLLNGDLIWSTETFRILGYEPFSIIPSYDLFLSKIHPDDRQFLDDNVKRSYKENKPYSVDCRIVIDGVTVRNCNATGKVEYDSDNVPIRFIGTFQDITERKKIETELSVAKEIAENDQKLFYNLFNRLNSGVAIYEVIDNGKDFIFKYFNKAGERIDKQKKEDLIGKSIFMVRPDAERFGLIDALRKVLNSKEPVHLPLNIYKDNVLEGYYENYIFPLPSGELVAVFDDITEKIKHQNELKKAKEKAEEASRLKTEFLNNLSHEIRTPMNGIIGFSELLDESGLSEGKRSYYSRIIQNSGHQLLRIIDDILEMSALETKQEVVSNSQFCLNDLLMELFSIFSLKSKERGISIYLKKDMKDENSSIVTDKAKLTKIMSNLIENAIKFTNEGFIEIGYYFKDKNLVLYVKDTGIGISSDNLDMIFDRFSQEEKEISRKYGGLGLGLSISKENARLLGGKITVESRKGIGSTFYIILPHSTDMGNRVKLEEKNISKIGANRRIYTVLVAEDEEVDYLYIETLLKAKKVNNEMVLIHARNGQEAIDFCLKGQKIDLVLMDIKMPVMSGYEAAEKIKAAYPDLPIIAQTAYSTEKDREMALRHGCDDFISKPLNMEEFMGLVSKHIRPFLESTG